MRKAVSKKIIFTLAFGIFSFLAVSFLSAPAVWADEVKDLKERVEALEEHQGEIYHTLEEKKSPGHMERIAEKISFGGLVEVEIGHESAEDTTNGIVAATVELAIDAEINENVNAHVLLLWEEHDPIAMDEATIEVTTPYGMVVTAGKMYIPFGVFNSHFVSDPLTLELGEANQSAALVSFEQDMFSVSVGAFNGHIEDGGADVIENYVLSATVTPMEDVSVGFSYISNIAETERDFGLLGVDTVIDKVAGFGVSASVAFQGFSIEGEYVSAVEEFDVLDLDIDVDGNGDKPSAFNLEVAYQVNDKIEVAAKYEGNTDMFDLPENQFGVVASYELFEHTALGVEYLHGEFATAGTEDRDLFTTQLAVEF